MRRAGTVAAATLALLAGCSTSVAAPPPVAPSAVAAARTVVSLGDSVPAGGACDCEPFPDLYAQRVGGRSINLAVNGATTDDIADLLEDAATRDAVRHASEILLMVGANDMAGEFPSGDTDDYRTIADHVQRSVTTIVRRLRDIRGSDIPVLVLGYWNVVEDGAVARADYDAAETAEAASATAMINDHLDAAARAARATYVATLPVFKGADGADDPTRLLADDGDHPNARGHAAIASALPD